MNVVTVFLSIVNQIEFHFVQNEMENCHHKHVTFNLKGNRNIVFSVQTYSRDTGDGSRYHAGTIEGFPEKPQYNNAVKV